MRCWIFSILGPRSDCPLTASCGRPEAKHFKVTAPDSCARMRCCWCAVEGSLVRREQRERAARCGRARGQAGHARVQSISPRPYVVAYRKLLDFLSCRRITCLPEKRIAAKSAPGLGSPLPHLRKDRARHCHICAATARTAQRSG